MNLRNEFNRIGHLFHNGVDKTQQATQGWAETGAKQAVGIAGRMRRQMDTGARGFATTEEAIVRHVRQNPALYLMGAALLIGALVAKVLIEMRQTPRTPVAPIL